MALVAYDNSDSSDFEDDEDTEVNLKNKIIGTSNVSSTTTLTVLKENGEPSSEEIDLFNLLPQPSNKKTATVIEEDDEFLHKKETPINTVRPKAKITVPSLSDFKDVENNATNYKPRAPSNKKSGLLSMLPQPKYFAKTTTTSKSLIPHVLTKKPESTVKKKTTAPLVKTKPETKLAIDYSDESETEEDGTTDFFSINKKHEIPDVTPIDMNQLGDKDIAQSKRIESYFKKDTVENDVQGTSSEIEEGYSKSYSQEPMHTDGQTNQEDTGQIQLDDEAIRQLCGARGKRKHEEIQIVDVNQEEVLGDSREWLLKGLMDDTTTRVSASKKKGNEPTSQQKRKHQITYLAHQAKANEAELQNQWANNRMSRRQTQSKYGF